ncbi:MAG: Uma2 family endonuclease [Polyangiales bacterium]
MHTAKPLPATVVYPETDHMGEHETQFQIAVRLVPLVVAWLALKGVTARVAGDQFWYFVKGEPKHCRAPDVYVVEGVAQDAADRAVWKTWEGHHPAFALEVASDDWKKDYDDAPPAYDAMRCKELVIFDPGATPRSRKRIRWQVYRRVRGRGFVRVFAGQGDRVESRVLGCWVRLVDEGGNPRLRLATAPHGDELVPTDAERAAAERAAREVERAAREVERAAREAERARADAAEAEVARLRALLDRTRR